MPIAWESFLARYRPMALAIARSLARPPASPEDVVQEAALALHSALAREPERFEGHEHARNYFLRAVRNAALRSRRDERHERPLESEPEARDDEAAEQVRERQRVLARLLAELAPAERELIARRWLERRTLASIAAETGVPVSTLHDRERALLAELRRRLARELGDAGQEEAV